ncbi:MAG: dephospho-CoA kinase, partial [Eggerthellales bacterium]|nr:dephospho-CoA kinase [Eggerthellales bacterium]
MKTIFVIGGMGAGKSTASRALASQGIPLIDLDVVGHEALTLDVVAQELAAAFGPQVLDAQGNVIRGEVAAAAFASEQATQMLNGITQPRIRELLAQKLNALEREGQ